jgi:hypothetical protein
MAKIKFAVMALLIIAMVALPLFAGCGASVPATVTQYIGGSFGVTGPYAEDCAAVLAAFQDYAQYVNDWHKLSPWGTETFPEQVKLEVKWLDDGGVDVQKAQNNYEALKVQGLLMQRMSGSAIAQAMKATLVTDQVGATTQASGPYLLTPTVGTIFMNYPIYTDQCAAMADWFMDQWKAAGNTAKPRVAYFTNDAFGRTLLTTQMDDYLKGIGYELVGTKIIPIVPTTPPTTELLWMKDNNVDLTLGAMTCIGSEPSMLEADRLDMGPNKAYKITFGLCSPSHLCVYTRDMGAKGDGLVVAGSYPCFSDTAVPGVAFALDIQSDYRPDKPVTHIMYLHGLVEAMIQVDALRLALANTGKSADQLTSADVLTQGFYKISNLDTGGIIPSLMTYGPNDVEGAEVVRIDQAQNGAVVELGEWPLRHVYAH